MPHTAGAWSTPLATQIRHRLTEILPAAANPAKAIAMRAYMRDQFLFLGINAPAQKILAREVLAGLDKPAEHDLRAVALGCWSLPEREYQYFACSLLRRHAKVCSARFIDTAEHLLVTLSWWDTVDTLAAHLVGPLVSRHPELGSTMDAWAGQENMWLVRTAILHQLSFKEATDAERLFRYCVRQAGHPDFFIRKAIGWALREYSRTAPAEVRAFVRTHDSRLARLSVREAIRNL